ncbi:MAG: Cof-type HAD-IIB family hydrolase [Anaerorhabdus sp.]|uniref:Cof-type HAD-IIB family hydrolase n=1 Tax=Anaerorhabdus sp. TaxID=1872524 RepID=UPI002FCC5B49
MEKAIFIDLDGTLMQKNLTISSRNSEALIHAIDEGYRVVLVSGRPIQFVNYLTEKIGKEIDAIGFNGAYSPNLIEYPISEEILIQLYNSLNKNNVSVIFKSINHIYANKEIIKNFVYPIANDLNVDYTEHCSIEQFKNQKIYKILGLYNNNEQEINNLLDQFDMTKAFYANKGFELTHKNANKGNAIKLYCLKNNISIKDSYMFGDDVNDQTMFALGGHNMVMGNASDDIKRCATAICENCEDDGVGKMIEKILKGENND